MRRGLCWATATIVQSQWKIKVSLVALFGSLFWFRFWFWDTQGDLEPEEVNGLDRKSVVIQWQILIISEVRR